MTPAAHVRYIVQEGKRTIALATDEAKVLIRGEVPGPMADRLERLGFRLPKVARPYTLMIRTPAGQFSPVTLRCRRAA